MQLRPHNSWKSILTLAVFIVIMAGFGRGCIRWDREFRAIQRGIRNVDQYARHVEDAAAGADRTDTSEYWTETTGTDHDRTP